MSFEKPTVEDWIVSAIMAVIVLFAYQSYFDSRRSAPKPSVLSAQQTISPQPTKLEEKVILDINETRRTNDLSPLELDFTLMKNAKTYAGRLAEKCGKLEHSNLKNYLDGEVAGQTIRKYGENLAIHISSLDGALSQLKDSLTHYDTMNGDYTHAGVAVYHSAEDQCHGSLFVVQHFAKVDF